jgi:hypothetical protein
MPVLDSIVKLPAIPKLTPDLETGNFCAVEDSAKAAVVAVVVKSWLFVQPPNNPTNSIAMAGNKTFFELMFLFLNLFVTYGRGIKQARQQPLLHNS